MYVGSKCLVRSPCSCPVIIGIRICGVPRACKRNGVSIRPICSMKQDMPNKMVCNESERVFSFSGILGDRRVKKVTQQNSKPDGMVPSIRCMRITVTLINIIHVHVISKRMGIAGVFNLLPSLLLCCELSFYVGLNP